MKAKNFMIVFLLGTVLIAVTSCQKSNDDVVNSIDGIYTGTLTRTSSLKSVNLVGIGAGEGTAEVTMMGDHQIQVQCTGEGIDTTFMLNYYANNDSIMVCLTGNDFMHMYGHMLGEGHMGGSGHMGDMMGDIQPGETEWTHHMSDEHQPGDLHFGGFDVKMGTFTYSMQMMDGDSPYYLTFNGAK